MKELEVQREAEPSRRPDRRQCYAIFLLSTEGAHQLAADLYTRARGGAKLDFRTETRDVISDVVRGEFTVALVATEDVRRDAGLYVQALRQLLIDETEGE